MGGEAVLTWTPDHNIRLAREICGYEVQASPKGVHYIIDGDNHVRPLPDFLTDPGETLTTLAAWLKVGQDKEASIDFVPAGRFYRCELRWRKARWIACEDTLTQAIAVALYEITLTDAP